MFYIYLPQTPDFSNLPIVYFPIFFHQQYQGSTLYKRRYLTHFPNHKILNRLPTQRSRTSLNTQTSIHSMKPRRRSLRGQWSPLQIFIRPSSTATTTATVSHLDPIMRITPRGLPCNKITPKPIKKPPPTTQIPKNLPLALDHAPHNGKFQMQIRARLHHIHRAQTTHFSFLASCVSNIRHFLFS